MRMLTVTRSATLLVLAAAGVPQGTGSLRIVIPGSFTGAFADGGFYPMPGADGPARWSVFDPEGRLLGDVLTPARLRVHQIGPDFLVGVWTDELDVPYVRVYGLERR